MEQADKALDLDEVDAYTMSFKALHIDQRQQLKLDDEEVYEAFSNALFVAGLQISLLLISVVVMSSQDGFAIKLPDNICVLGIRFICSILMHLEVEQHLR